MYSGQIPSLIIPRPIRSPGKSLPLSEFQLSKVGFPIRKSTDQSLFAAPRGLSQRTTSFIASQRQGIHRMPLRHLIALIINAHPSARAPSTLARRVRIRPALRIDRALTERPASSRSPDRGGAVKRALRVWRVRKLITATGSDRSSLHDVRWITEPRQTARDRSAGCESWRTKPDAALRSTTQPRLWWSQTGSNRRPPACKAGALPTELWPPPHRAGSARDASPIAAHSRAGEWWAWEDLNFRPHAYQARALTN
jgi:hypothetical protein